MTTADLLEVNVFDPDVYANGDPARNGLPIELFARLRDAAPCVRLPCEIPGHEKSAWVLSRYEDVSTMLREPERYLSGSGVTMRATHTTVSEDGGKPAMITMDGAAHVRNRRLVNRGFTPAVVRSFEAALPDDRRRHRPEGGRPRLVRLRRRGGEPVPAPRHL